jgi:mannose-6-phosphate isomerase
MTMPLTAFRLEAKYAERVWGGQRLKPSSPPVGEAWIVWEGDRVASGPWAGRTLAEVSQSFGEDLLGRRPLRQTGNRFPLLIKLLDTAEWLSLQVHPNDEQAEALEGSGHFGKTEAWHILEADADAQLICGLRPGVTDAEATEAIRQGKILDFVQYLPVQSGDSVFVAGGTIHALGPGLLLYEVQQTSDITYRVYDWDRPQSAGRSLHIDQSVAVTNPNSHPAAVSQPQLADGASAELLRCPFFTLELIRTDQQQVELDPAGESFHALTAIQGRVQVKGNGWEEPLNRFDTVLVPANAGPYMLLPMGEARVLKATV